MTFDLCKDIIYNACTGVTTLMLQAVIMVSVFLSKRPRSDVRSKNRLIHYRCIIFSFIIFACCN